MYSKTIKHALDFFVAVGLLLILLPLLFILTLAGAIAMKGNPFFIQERPGKDEKIFKMIKFRTMSDEKDKKGELLPDEKRLKRYGKFLRKTSLDEIPELINIIRGEMSFVGPRPLLVRYLPYYSDEERKRHSVKPGLTGLAQINGRNNLGWNERLKLDVEYVEKVCFSKDVKILLLTIKRVLDRKDITSDGNYIMLDLDKERGGDYGNC